MMQIFRLLATMSGVWLLLSGLFKTQLLVLGVISVGIVVLLSYRLKVLEHRGQPIYFRFLNILSYWGWLLGQIVLSNIEVCKRVWSRELDIKPTLRRISATPDTEMGRVIYANSITLTPGTTTINFTADDDILVHALHEDSLHELELGEMAERIRKVEPYLRKKPGNT